jgi:hypothetical protein
VDDVHSYYVLESSDHDIAYVFDTACVSSDHHRWHCVVQIVSCIRRLHSQQIVHGYLTPLQVRYCRVEYGREVIIKLSGFERATVVGERVNRGSEFREAETFYEYPEFEDPGLIAQYAQDYFPLGIILWQLCNPGHQSPLMVLKKPLSEEALQSALSCMSSFAVLRECVQNLCRIDPSFRSLDEIELLQTMGSVNYPRSILW